jgi:hypothetical protein
MIIRSGALAAVQPLTAAGFNREPWNGAGGMHSSAAAADAIGLTALGCVSNASRGFASFGGGSGLTAGDVIVKHTYYGDADLSGAVTLDDFTPFLNGYQGSGST